MPPISTTKMKIVLILGKLNVGGSTHQVLHLASRLSHQGHTCVVLHGRANPDEQIMEREARELGVTTIEVPTIHNEFSFAPHIEVRAILTVFRILRELDPDVVHTHSAKAGLIGRVSASLARVPVVVHTFHGHLLKDYFGKCRSLMLRLMEMALGYLTTQKCHQSPPHFLLYQSNV